jgi:hypothetical protein
MLNNYKRERDGHTACENCLEELKKNGILRSFTSKNDIGPRGKIIDITFTLTPSAEFVDDQKRANARRKQSELQLKNGHKQLADGSSEKF